jgi:hypothetical protein
MRRPLRWLPLTVASAVGAALIAVLVLFQWLFGPSADVVARVPSPQGDLEAIVVETNGGATTSFGYEVSIVSAGSRTLGSPTARLYGARRNNQAYGVNVRWVSTSLLHVEFKQARQATLKKSTVEVADRKIVAALQSGVVDPAAPPGGMLYNLQGRK